MQPTTTITSHLPPFLTLSTRRSGLNHAQCFPKRPLCVASFKKGSHRGIGRRLGSGAMYAPVLVVVGQLHVEGDRGFIPQGLSGSHSMYVIVNIARRRLQEVMMVASFGMMMLTFLNPRDSERCKPEFSSRIVPQIVIMLISPAT